MPELLSIFQSLDFAHNTGRAYAIKSRTHKDSVNAAVALSRDIILNRQNDLAEVTALFHQAVGVTCVGERETRLYGNLDLP